MTNTLSSILLLLSLSASQDESANRIRSETLAGLELRSIGPALMSGRIADIAIHPANRHVWYVAVGSGGVWKTTNAATSWAPVFDDESSYSIGCVTIDPSHPEVIWVGTGENVSGRHVGYGDGVYKSLDGGRSWSRKGLEASEHIAKILVDPRSSDVVYVAAEGPLWSPGGERGVYKSMDGGETWNHILEVSDDTGVTDLELDPRNPDVLYAAAYQRRRSVWALMAGGPESSIYKTVDAGERWRELTNGLPDGDMGKIGLAVSPIDPDVVYATIEASEDEKGFYRSTDAGESWMKRSDYTSGGTGPHYYQEIYASPHELDRVYQMDVWIHVTEDGGATFRELGEANKHSDNHALAFVPGDSDYLLAGSDGGLYESFDSGESWKYVSNLPVTQIYKLAVDNDVPFYNVVGGMQDNGTQAGPARTSNVHGIRNEDWYVPYGADGYACQVDPENPDILYVTWQNGNLLRYDRRNGELVDIKPQPAPGDDPERWNWDSPILISPHSSTRLYFASQRLWRSDDRGDSWTSMSGDLSRNRNRYELNLMGRVWSVDDLYDNGAMSWYGNATALSESAMVEGLIYVGTDDGLIQVTEDGGANWRRVDSFPGVPESSFVQDVKASLHDPDEVFAVLDAHKLGDLSPYLLKSTDRGRSWSSIVGDRYSVQLSKLVDGVVTPLHEPASFEVVDLENATLTGTDRGETLAFQKETGDLYRKVLGVVDEVERTKRRLEFMKKAILETPGPVFPLMERATEIGGRLADIEKSLAGDRVRGRLSEPSTPSIRERIQRIVSGHWSSRYGPTLTHRENLRIASREYAETSALLRELIEVDLLELERAMEEAGAPWTPGRRIP